MKVTEEMITRAYKESWQQAIEMGLTMKVINEAHDAEKDWTPIAILTHNAGAHLGRLIEEAGVEYCSPLHTPDAFEDVPVPIRLPRSSVLMLQEFISLYGEEHLTLMLTACLSSGIYHKGNPMPALFSSVE